MTDEGDGARVRVAHDVAREEVIVAEIDGWLARNNRSLPVTNTTANPDCHQPAKNRAWS